MTVRYKKLIKCVRRSVVCVLVLGVIACMSSVACAYDMKTYEVDDIGISIQFPSSFDVLTRDINTPIYDRYETLFGVSKNNLLNALVSTNTYIDAFDGDITKEYLLRKTDASGLNFNDFSDQEWEEILPEIRSSMAATGANVTKTEIYNSGTAKYLKAYFNQKTSDYTTYSLEYGTEMYGKSFVLVMNSAGAKIDQDIESKMKAIVDSINFGEIPSSSPSTDAFQYREPSLGIEFTVPANWKQKEADQSYNFLKATFVKSDNSLSVISFGGQDMWDALPSSEKNGISRSVVNNSMFSLDEITDIIGGFGDVDYKKLTTVKLGSREYYKFPSTNSKTIEGQLITLNTINLICVDNGYIYAFAFLGDEDSQQYKDFELLVKSAVFDAPVAASSTPAPTSTPMSTPTSSSSSTGPSNTASNTSSGSSSYSSSLNWGNIILSIILTIAIYTLPVVIYRYAIVKEPLPAKKAKIVTLIYGAIAFVVMHIILSIVNEGGRVAPSGAIIVWSAVNYAVLSKGKRQNDDAEPAKEDYSQNTPVEPTIFQGPSPIETAAVQNPSPGENTTVQDPLPFEQQEQIVYTCKNCGMSVPEDSVFCPYCGQAIK